MVLEAKKYRFSENSVPFKRFSAVNCGLYLFSFPFLLERNHKES